MRRLAPALILAAAALLAPPADATTVVALDEGSLVRSSAIIALVHVESIQSTALPVGPGVFTDVILRVIEPLRGQALAGDALTIRIPGGVLGQERAVRIEGMPDFVAGEELVVFLEALPAFPDGVAAYLPMGLNQGVWRLDHAGRYAPGAQEGLLGPADPAVAPLPGTLAELRARVGAVGSAP